MEADSSRGYRDRDRDDRRSSADDDRGRRPDRDDRRPISNEPKLDDFDKRDKLRDKGVGSHDYDRDYSSRVPASSSSASSYTKDQGLRGRDPPLPLGGAPGLAPSSTQSGLNGSYGSRDAGGDRDFGSNRTYSSSSVGSSTGRDFSRDFDRSGRDNKPRDSSRASSPPRRDAPQDRGEKDRSWDDKYYGSVSQSERSRSYTGSHDLYSSQPPLPPATMATPPISSYSSQPPLPSLQQPLVRGRSAQEQLSEHMSLGDDHPSKRARLGSSGLAPPVPPQQSQYYAPPTSSYMPTPAPVALDSRAKFIQRLATGWVGSLSLKNMTLKVQLQFMRGNLRLSDSVFPPQGSVLTTSQRMRLEPRQLDAISVRMRSETDYALLFVLPATDVPDPAAHQDAFNRNFVQYLIEKQAAGIVKVATGIIYLFPPCQFSFAQIQSIAPDLIYSEADLREYLLALVFRNV